MVGLDDNWLRRILGADCLGGEAHEGLELAAWGGRAGLQRLVDEVVSVNTLAPPEAACYAPPNFDKVVGEPGVVEHIRLVRRIVAPRWDMQVEDDHHAVFARQRQDDRVEVVEAALKPAVVFVEVLIAVHAVPVADHLEAQERDAPGGKRPEIALGHVAPRRHDATKARPPEDVGGVGAAVVVLRHSRKRSNHREKCALDISHVVAII